MTWNSTLKPSTKPLARKTGMQAKQKPMQRSREKRGKGLAQRVAESLGRAVQHARGESQLLRSEQHRRNVSALSCACCGKAGPSQCAHANATKGMGQKVCDSLTFPLCPDCHRDHDQGGTHTKTERWKREWELVDATRAELLKRNLWPASVEAHYQRAIVPLARMVHPEEKECPTSAATDSGVARISKGV